MLMKSRAISMLLKPNPMITSLKLALGITALASGMMTIEAQAKAPVTIERLDSRLYGYQLGDIIPESVDIHLAPGYHFDPQSLPKNGKRAGWFMVRSSRYSQQDYSDGSSKVRLTIEMQLINSPSTVRSLTIPPIALKFKGPENLTDTLPSLTIDAAPLDTGDVRTGLPDAQGPRPAKLIPTQPTQLALENLSFIAGIVFIWLLVTLLIQRFSKRKTKPFAAANRELGKLLNQSRTIEGARSAARCIHRAFDQTAGQRLFGEGVAAFCAARGVNEELLLKTEAFYATSQMLFFQAENAEHSAELLAQIPKQMRELVKAWKKFEAKHKS